VNKLGVLFTTTSGARKSLEVSPVTYFDSSPTTVAPPYTAPFAGIKDASNNLVCNGTTLSATYSGYNTNSKIISLLDGGIIPSVNTGSVQWWPELHAQAFALYLSDQMARPVIDQLFSNGFLGCAYYYASTELGVSQACNYQLHAGYQPFQ
jgi:hypothetical protein